MEFKLIRNFDQKKDYEQEKYFEESTNLRFFFSTEKTLYGIDDWNFPNLKRLLHEQEPIKITLTFQKWNSNIEYLYNQLNLQHNVSFLEVSSKMNDCIAKKDTTLFHVLIKELDDQSKFEVCLYLLSLLKNDLDALKLVNFAMNTRLINFNKILNLLFFKYIMRSFE